MHSRTAACVAIAALLNASVANAERPLQTEDADILDPGACQIESALASQKASGERTDAAYVQFGCGTFKGTQLALAIGRTREPGERNDDLVFSGKTALIALSEDAPGLAVAYAIAGSRPQDQGLRLAQSAAKLVYTYPKGPLFLHANLGWSRDTDARSDSTTWNLAAERTGVGPIDVMAEIFGNDHDAPWVNAALRWWLIDKKFWVDASYGVQIDSRHARLATVGLKLTF